MSNYNKSFNFRNGVQVDEDDLIVRGSLVGIGTTIPRSELDVRGNVDVTGLVTSTNLYVSGIATFNDVRIGSGVTIYGSTGIISATFYGDGSNLQGLPTSKWNTYQSGTVTSIFTEASFVGVGTTNSTASLQIGGSVESGYNGVGISTDGNIYASGIVTATTFVGSGANLTGLSASQITSGTISEDRLPENLNVTGIITAATLQAAQINNTGIATISDLKLGQTNISGVATVGFATVSAAYVNNLTVGVATVATLNATSSIAANTITGLQNIAITGIATVGLVSASDAYVTGVTTTGTISATTGTITNLTVGNAATLGNATATNVNVTGIVTSASIKSTQINNTGIATLSAASITGLTAGVTTSTKIRSGAVRIGYGLTNEIDTFDTDLLLDSAGGTVIIDDNLSVTGIATITGALELQSTLSPTADLGADLGTSLKYFQRAYVGEVNIGIAASNEIATRSNTLILDSAAGVVQVDDNLVVTGYTYLTGITTVQDSILPDTDQDAALGSASLRFSDAYIDNIRIGVGSDNEVSTGSGNLKLNSSSKLVEVADRFKVTGESYLAGISTVETGLLPDDDKGAYLGSSSKSFSEAYIDEIRIGVGGTNIIDTREGDLVLDSQTDNVVISNDLTVNQVTNLSNDLYVGTNDFYVDQSTNRIGIGTSAPSNDIEVVRNGSLTVELVSQTGSSVVAIGQSLGIGNSSATIQYAAKNLNISNRDTGNVDSYVHSGGVGVNTGNFNWFYGQSNSNLMTLTYEGNLGIGETTPSERLTVGGGVTVSGNAYISGDLTIDGNLNANINYPKIINGSNLYNSSGITTLSQLEVTNNVDFSYATQVSLGSTVAIGTGVGSTEYGLRVTNGINANIIEVTDGINVSGLVGFVTALTVCATGGFKSTSTDANAIQINYASSPDRIIFNVVGIGSTTLQLF